MGLDNSVSDTLVISDSGGVGTNNRFALVPTGALTLTPATNVVTSGQPLIIQNVSQAASPGTTVNGQIRLFEATATGDARIVAQINGTTYNWVNDSGFTFYNRPVTYQDAKDQFTVHHPAWQNQKRAALQSTYNQTRAALLPGYQLPVHILSWDSLSYAAMLTFLDQARDSGNDVPTFPSWTDINAQNPHPDPSTYKIADSTLNETADPTTGEDFAEGDVLTLCVDSVTTAPGGEVQSVHAVTCDLQAQILKLLNDDATFRADFNTALAGCG